MTSYAEKKISCAVIGLGNFGRHYVRLLAHDPRVTLSAVVSPSAHTRALELRSGIKRYTDTKKVFEDPSIDAVVIATPVSTHADIAIKALRAGKHVLLEKPLAVNFEEAEKIKHAVDASKKIFMLGHQYLYNDYIAELRKELDGGRIGRTRYIHAEHLYSGPIRHDIGCFREAGTHELALIDHLFAPGKPVTVVASGIDLSGGRREDFATASITYESGLFAHIVVSSYAPAKSRRMIFGGDEGMALFDGRAFEEKLSFFLQPFPKSKKMHQKETLSLPKGETLAVAPSAPREPLFLEIEHFLDCIETGATPRSDIAHAMRVERVLEAVHKAMNVA